MIATSCGSSFGAKLDPGGTSFRLWAPHAQSVELLLSDEEPIFLEQTSQGFYEVFVPGLRAGATYRYRIDSMACVADPASRFQPENAEGWSEVIDLEAYVWQEHTWKGRPWVETVLYELHVGTFTPEGTYRSAIERLDHLVHLGITAIELMPLAETPGARTWGYDGVLLYAPNHNYGRPQDLQAFIDAAHARHISVFLDVVYNHFGPQGNYLSLYAPDFFTNEHMTPWGPAIHLSGQTQEPVRRFFIDNALMWLQAYRFDGIRFDAAQELRDHEIPGFLKELALTIRTNTDKERSIHLILENEDNNVHLLSCHRAHEEQYYDAQWNDDLHHALHVVATGETVDYYQDYAEDPIGKLIDALSEGFVYQGQFSAVRNRQRGSPSAFLPPISFVAFLQNHDQIGNRALGERLGMIVKPRILGTMIAIVLLSPMIPMIFMGDEWNASSPFLYFCDFEPNLAQRVTQGRRQDFMGFPDFSDVERQGFIPDPNALDTFEKSHLRWHEVSEPEHEIWLNFYRELLTIRRREITSRLNGIEGFGSQAQRLGQRAFLVRYTLGDGSILRILANLDDAPFANAPATQGRIIYANDDVTSNILSPWSIRASLDCLENYS